MHRVLVVNGPNLNWLGKREPEVYGTETLKDVESMLLRRARSWDELELQFFQSNSEGEIIDWLQVRAPEAHGLIINPGGLTHSSVSLRDAIAALELPTLEVHISNIFAREPFRRRSLIAGACVGCISGLGAYGYVAALDSLAQRAQLAAAP
jgi:3-dehydroquinate dehydratase-2